MTWTDPIIVILLFVLWSWSLPDDEPAKRLASRGLLPVLWLGLWHSWKMFAPDPAKVYRKLVIEITYSDRTKREWQFPVLNSQTPAVPFLCANECKFIENVIFGSTNGIRTSWVNYCIRQPEYTQYANGHPVTVTLHEDSTPMQLPGTPDQPAASIRKILFTHQVAREVQL